MIDEKKIEEAAHDYVGMICENEKYKIFWLVFRAFKFAIDWFLGNLWHDADEPPKDKSVILLKYTSPFFRWATLDGVDADDWDDTVKELGITRWLYIEDLMKGGK